MSAAGIYKLQTLQDGNYNIECAPWKHNSMQPNTELNPTILEPLSLHDFHPLNKTVPTPEDTLVALVESADPLSQGLELLSEEANQLLAALQLAVYRRVGRHSYYCGECREGVNCSDSHIAIMFSGGIDSMMLAHLADKCVPKAQSIDLLNVAFENSNNVGNYDVPDRVTGRHALTELSTDRVWNFVEVCAMLINQIISAENIITVVCYK